MLQKINVKTILSFTGMVLGVASTIVSGMASQKAMKEEVAKEKPNKEEKPKKIEKEEKAEDKPKKVEKEEENNIDIDFDKLDEEFEKIMSDDV